MPERLAKRLLIIGWDAADWKIIDSLFAVGAMPNLHRLVDQGVRANLASLEPRLSPLLWTTVATGKTADQHGILNFVEPDPSGVGLRLASSTTRKTKAIWNILTQSNLRTNVVSWYASHPAEPIRGVNVSNLFYEGLKNSMEESWPMPTGAVHPPEFAEQVANARMHPQQMVATHLLPLVPRLAEAAANDGRVATLARNIAHCVSVHNSATLILDQDASWDCTMVFYETIDTVGHNFMQYHPPRMPHVSEQEYALYQNVMLNVYQFHDMMLGALLELAGPDTTVMLLSDHGFYSDHRRPVVKDLTNEQRAMIEPQWHRPLGVLVMSGPGIRRQQRIYGASLLDIAPTALTLLGLPIGADMSGRVLIEAFDRAVNVEKVISWDMVAGEAGMHPADLRQDPFESRDAINQLIALGYMADLPADSAAQLDQAWCETQANLGAVYTNSGHAGKAVAVFEELVRKHPQERRFVFALVRAMYVDQKLEACEEVLRRFLQRHPEDVDAKVALVMVLAAQDRVDQAASIADEVECEHDGRLDREAVLGEMCSALQRWDGADRHFRLALQNDPESAAVHHGLAQASIGRENFEDAVDHCLNATQLVHVFPEAHQTLGVALTWLKDYDHAIKSFEVALSMRPGLLDSQRYLASIYRHLGNADKAAEHRRIAERLMKERGSSQVNYEFLRRNAPLGPQEWVARVGSKKSGS